jgi:Tfp pilus assembly protein PilN
MSIEDIGPKPPNGLRRDEESAARRLLRVKQATLGIVVVILVVVLVGFGVGLWAILRQSQANHALAEQVKSCTDPAGKCYQEQQARTADIVGVPKGPINTVTVLAIYCQATKGAGTVPTIIACVEDQLRALKKRSG